LSAICVISWLSFLWLCRYHYIQEYVINNRILYYFDFKILYYLLSGGGAGGGLYAEAGTPHGQGARAGLGGAVDGSGGSAGNFLRQILEY
jgi:hypothetical protein